MPSWFFFILPFIIRKEIQAKNKKSICYIWDSSNVAFIIARVSGRFIGVSVNKISYKIQDVHDEKGDSVFLKMMYMNSWEVQAKILTDPVFKSFLNDNSDENKLKLYIEKFLLSYDMANTATYDHLLNALLLIRVSLWKALGGGFTQDNIFLFIRKRRWFKAIEHEALIKYHVKLIALPSKLKIDFKRIIRRAIPIRFINALYFFALNRFKHRETLHPSKLQEKEPRIATEYSGHLNLEQPECYSDLFFLQQSNLKGQDVLLMFNSSDPLDQKKYDDLFSHSINPVALSPRATQLSYSSIFNPRIGPIKNMHKAQGNGSEIKWLNEKQADYNWWRSYWTELFAQFNVKVYTTWYKYDSQHAVISDAIQSLGGVATIYQRSYESISSPIITINVDIEFGFSKSTAMMERQNRSNILYHVTTGYFGDHRFPLLRAKAKTIRNSLLQNGADHILAYFDENTIEDPRWYLGHDFARKNYAFLLQKVMSDTNFGLVLKPKNPSSLLYRLGPIADLLKEAIATGRCYLFSEGVIQGSYPPAAAALAADIAVHDGISSATAGMEAALCGIPTLLMDQDGWSVSDLYALGKGKVVFNDWESLWEAYDSHRSSREGIIGFGDWSPMLNEIDPFRDGRAAERIGTYLKWLLDGFKAGLSRETVMADAAELYCRQWGYDKIVSIP